jgi:phosphohistidine swiveling domain-containing protein
MISKRMKEMGIEGDVLTLFRFIQVGIEGREYAKYLFTKNLSDALELFAKLGAKYGFSREEISFADISVINEMYSGTPDEQELLKNSIQRGQQEYHRSKHLVLPPVIMTEEDIYGFYLQPGQANYITLHKKTAEVVSGDLRGQELKGKIVLIKAADPGYDWIFSHQIAGFITAYGGANSHMAIRAGELNIPAVIGVGETEFRKYEKANKICVDCQNKKVEIAS